MAHSNSLVSFLRHYGPIPASDNMYDELIQDRIRDHAIDPAIRINPARLNEVQENFESASPRNVILTGTAGDGKTYHCRCIWEHFGGDPKQWEAGKKVMSLQLPASGKTLTIVKDLSELTSGKEKDAIIAELALSVEEKSASNVFLVATNDGQLLATWRDWSDMQDENAHRVFKIVENMLVEERTRDKELVLDLYNLSCLDASTHFKDLVQQIVEHRQWSQCQGCELLKDDGTSTCPIRINRERLRSGTKESVFIQRLGDLIKLARANRMHLPIRDLLLLAVNILLGDQQSQKNLLTCRTAKKRADKKDYQSTNPYANVFGMNLQERKRQQYQVFMILEAFGIGRETDNKFDNLLIYGKYVDQENYNRLVSADVYYGTHAYENYLSDYLERERGKIDNFMRALTCQRQRLFFSLPPDENFNPWRLTVYQASGEFLKFVSGLANSADVSQIKERLILGLNRTFCGMMVDDSKYLYLTSSGGDGRGRIASLLRKELPTKKDPRICYLSFKLAVDQSTPCLEIIDPLHGVHLDGVVDSLNLQLAHFEYLVRVARGSLPASFSRQCNEDFLDFKLRLIKQLDEPSDEQNKVNIQVLTVAKNGKAQIEDLSIKVNQ